LRHSKGKRRITTKLSALSAYRAGKLRLPPGYRIERDADLMTLHRADGSMVAAFAAGAAPSEVVRTAEDDYHANGKSSA
jgi:hypothetical protein